MMMFGFADSVSANTVSGVSNRRNTENRVVFIGVSLDGVIRVPP
jgi:hypothetical protein